MKKNVNIVPNENDMVSARRAELKARLDSYFRKANPLEEQAKAPCIGRSVWDSIKEPDELPPGVEKNDLRRRNVLYRGLMSVSNGRTIYLFVVKEANDKDWGTSIAIESNEMPLLQALDKKLEEVKAAFET